MRKNNHQQEQGFALLETVVALAIMALVGLMAWRGMDAMIRGRETIDRRANQDASYFQLVRQFERDCQESLRRDEIAPLFATATSAAAGTAASSTTTSSGTSTTGSSGTGTGTGASPSTTLSIGNTSSVASLAAGAKNIWWLRRYRADNQDAWMIVGYGMSATGLQRLSSRPLLRRSEAGTLWAGISRDPDLISSELLVSLEVPSIERQAFQVQTSAISGAGSNGISASGTGSPVGSSMGSSMGSPPASPTASTTANSGSGAASIAPISNIYPDTQGVTMQWWIQGNPLPISRSCLMGGAL
jgi:type II secretory pathway pseudopilin PulG